MLDEQDFQVEGAVHTIQGNSMKAMCKTCGIVKENNHFHSTDPDRCSVKKTISQNVWPRINLN